jgi:phosphatidylserine decarboxylase
MSIEELSSSYCFRDPLRPIKNNHEVIYSPSDGIIVDYSSITSLEDCIYGKYGNVSLNKLSYGMIPEGEYDVVSIFLTFYDAHIVRIPINGIAKRVNLPPYFVEDHSMLDMEKNIMSNKFSSVRKELITCFAYNERVLYSIKSPFKQGEMYLILTADYDIDTILSFATSEQPLKQNQRLASIRYGSMVTCIIPKQWNCKFVCKENIHIEAGIDALFMYE